MSELVRLHFETRAEWLAGRGRGIGASEAASAIGIGPWETRLKLWKEKLRHGETVGERDNESMQRGREMEDAIRNFFMAQNPEYALEYYPFDILFQSDRPWLFATLDGELTERETGRKGILEIKTSRPNGATGWAQWRDQVPQHYFAQNLHQMLATGYDFAVLYAALYDLRGGITFPPPYVFERSEHEGDMEWLLERETAFWRHVENGTMPSQILTL